MEIQRVLPDCQVVLATTEEAVQRHLPEAEIIVSTVFFHLHRECLQKAKKLRYIQIAGVGVDHVDLVAAQELGIAVANVEGANAVGVAEHVVMSALALLRGLIPADAAMKKGEWPFDLWARTSWELAGKTVGIVGMGRTGKEVACRLAPFGVSLLFYARRQLDLEEKPFNSRQVDLATLLAQSDIVTLHLPLTPETHNLLNKDSLYKMKQGAFLINTSRAGLVDEDALIAALNGHLAGASLDVFHQEPPPENHSLRKLSNVILTPHGSGVTVESQGRIAQGVIQNIWRYLNSQPLVDLKA